MKNYKRDKLYPKRINWNRLYEKYFPYFTDSTSRHVKVISDSLRDVKSPLRKLLIDAGYEPDHMASSMEHTVKMLWEERHKNNHPKNK